MSNKNCITQVNIPEIDNTQLECDELISSTCVVIKEHCSKVGNLEGENLDQFIGRLCSKLAVMDNKIYLLQNETPASSENVIRVPSATYSELGITPESTVEEKQTAISTFLEGYNNLGTDILLFEIKENEVSYNFDMTGTWNTLNVNNEEEFKNWFSQSIYGGGSEVTVQDFIKEGDRIRANVNYISTIYGGIMYENLSAIPVDASIRLYSIDKIGKYDSIGTNNLDFNFTEAYRPVIKFDLMQFLSENNNITQVYFNMGGAFFLPEDLQTMESFINNIDMNSPIMSGKTIRFSISDGISDSIGTVGATFTNSNLYQLMVQKGIQLS